MAEDKTTEQLLREHCQEYFEAACKDDSIDDDLERYIFEKAMEFCLGDDVWKKIEIGKKKYAIEVRRKQIEAIQAAIDKDEGTA